ncbi:MAG: SelT/SelW/SelH family protein [Planctomycetes bacterium]|nr:SelT/SelW/SelH family protein [Planctomycetota bacterium]
MASKVLSEYKQKIEGFELEPSQGGCFELTVGGELIYSKLATEEFPDEDAMLAEVGKRL